MMSQPTEDIAEAHAVRKVDTKRAGDGVWLVKVPKYLGEVWEKAGVDGQIGKLVYQSNAKTGQSDVSLVTSDALLDLKREDSDMIPKVHQFRLNLEAASSGASNATRSVAPIQDMTILEESVDEASGKKTLSFFGKVNRRAECRPPPDMKYMRLKRTQLEKTNRPPREIQRLTDQVRNFRPVADHKNNVEYQQRMKTEGKHERRDRESVQQDLFKAFERHQYYKIIDLVSLTKQPVLYLKSILSDIACYNMKPPHKNMWELKEEYRHYKPQPGETPGPSTSSK